MMEVLGGKTGVGWFCLFYFFVFKNWARVWAWVDWVLDLVLVINKGPFVLVITRTNYVISGNLRGWF